ncbi:MAG: hypothetical protein R2879_21570, partial [Saprospiraceae bacterium]
YLIDIESKQPVGFATLQCISTVEGAEFTFATSDDKGIISVCKCAGGDSIKWKIRHVSYLPIDTIFPCKQVPDTLFLYSKDYEFGEVILSAKNEGVRVIGDSIRFDLSVFRKPHQKDLKDLLKDLPGITIEEGGQVKYKGKAVGQILLSGRSAARGNFDFYNRVVRKEDLSTVQLYPDDPAVDQADQNMTLDLVLKPDLTLLGQIQSRLSNQAEIEGSASIIRTGDTRWNHSAEAAISQIADPHRPQLNPWLETVDNTFRNKKAIHIKPQKPDSYQPFIDLSKEDQNAFAFYNALYQDDKSELNLYSRYKNHSSTRQIDQTNFNVNTSEILFRERNNEELDEQSGLFSLSWKYQLQKNLTLNASSHLAQDVNEINQNGLIEFADFSTRKNNWSDQSNNQNAVVFGHVLWEIDSTWNFQTGVQFGIDNRRRDYDFTVDSIIYGIRLNPNAQDENLGYQLNRDQQNFDAGAALEHKWKSLNQTTTWIVNYNARSLSDAGGFDETSPEVDVFRNNQAYEIFTTSSVLEHKMEVSKFKLTGELGGTFFKSKQVLTGNDPFKWTGKTRMSYSLNRAHSIFLNYNADANWLDENYLWRSLRPRNLQTYSRAGNSNPAIIRNHLWSAGWKEFSQLKGNFSNAQITYQYAPIHYQWRQRTEIGYNVDTLVRERDFNKIGLELTTSRNIRGVRFSIHLIGAQSYSYGEALFTDQKLLMSNLTLQLGARDILTSKIIFIALKTRINRTTWQFGEQTTLPPQWNSNSTIEARWFITKFDAWLASELTYLWRGNIYNETLVSALIEKKLGEHFMVSLGGENLLNLNNNTRRNRFLSPEGYQESEQTVFGGRVYVRVKYQL